MSTKNYPAFPVEYKHWEHLDPPHILGLTKLEWFAGMALQGMLAYSHINPNSGNFVENCSIEQAAQCAFSYAEAMITEGEKRSK